MIPNGKSINGDVAEIWKVKDGKRDSRTICLRLIHLKLIQNDAIEGYVYMNVPKHSGTFFYINFYLYKVTHFRHLIINSQLTSKINDTKLNC